jgi:hypothetical protein
MMGASRDGRRAGCARRIGELIRFVLGGWGGGWYAASMCLPCDFFATIPWGQIGFAALGIIVLVVAVCIWGYRQRHRHLTEKHGDPEVARSIMRGVIWQGETQEQVLDSLGRPEDIDRKVLKTKTKEIWKYRPTARNRFGLKITLDDGVVTGWEQND